MGGSGKVDDARVIEVINFSCTMADIHSKSNSNIDSLLFFLILSL